MDFVSSLQILHKFYDRKLFHLKTVYGVIQSKILLAKQPLSLKMFLLLRFLDMYENLNETNLQVSMIYRQTF